MRPCLYFCFIFTLPGLTGTMVLSGFGVMRHLAGTGNEEDENSRVTGFEGTYPLSVELSNPRDCGTDDFGLVYIVDKESHSVLRISSDGSSLTTVAGTHRAGNGPDSETAALSVALNNPNGLHVLWEQLREEANRALKRPRWLSIVRVESHSFPTAPTLLPPRKAGMFGGWIVKA